MKHTMFIALAVALAAAGIASAATDGTAGPDSTATVDMSLTVSNPAPQIQITGLQNFDLDIAPGANATPRHEACVYVSQPGILYSLTIDGPALTDGSTTYDYVISGTSIISTTSRSYTYAYGTDPNPYTQTDLLPSNTSDCSDNTVLTVNLNIADTSVRTNGSATTTITMTVKPQ